MSKVAVIGAGTMGNGIAHVFAQHEWQTLLIDVNAEQLKRGRAMIEKNTERQVSKGTLTEDRRHQMLGRITTTSNIEILKGVSDLELVVEAITENPQVKFDTFRALSRLTAPSAILASNTSSISITEIAGHTGRAANVIGMHFMNPVPVMPLVEVVRGRETGDQVVDRVVEIAKQLGKTPVVVRDAPGFVSNRVLMPMINEAILCVQEGVATPAAVDQVMTLGMKHPLGPLALADLIGLDVCLAIMEVLRDGFANPKYEPARLLRDMVAQGKLGRKSGAGFYGYSD
ncbi:MAG TPA: 3-hydroxyacyl-CoA dehydrogenase NAD-binding domain-containing protein [Gemmatimonadales bacterium]|nr:3-hydroxyacyl-CoA dehydrogenase NAD-binding domain-containing protein [Gemmatimonadales bacterium]